MGTFPPNKVKNYLIPVGIISTIKDNNGNLKDIITESLKFPEYLHLGESELTAYRGDRGKIAYDHSLIDHAPINAVPLSAVKSDSEIALALLNSHAPQSDNQIIPTTLPASDVYMWAKAPTKPTYTFSEVGAASASDPRFTDSRPASDVYAWAKAATKPTYGWGEITGKPTVVSAFTNDAGYLTAITKVQVEAVLTGAITSHTHNYQAPLTTSDLYLDTVNQRVGIGIDTPL